jgi:hypothetical protein
VALSLRTRGKPFCEGAQTCAGGSRARVQFLHVALPSVLAAFVLAGCGGRSAADSSDASLSPTTDGPPIDGASSSPDAEAPATATVYKGVLDANGDATLVVPEITLQSMPLAVGYVFSSSYAEPGWVMLGNIVLGDGEFHFAAGAAHGGAAYQLVVGKGGSHRARTGALDANGDATVSVPEIQPASLPITLGYVYSTSYAESGWIPLGNIIPRAGEFRFAAGTSNAGANYILVTLAAPASVRYTGTLDNAGDATLGVPEIHEQALPLMLGYVFTKSYAEPGWAPLGNIIPGTGVFRFAAGPANSESAFILVGVE